MKTSNSISEKANPNIRPWLFLGLTLGLTWLLEFTAAGIQPFVPEIWTAVLRTLGGAMPLLVALLLLFTQHERAFRVEFWRRIVDPKRIPPVWWAVILLFVPFKSGLAALIDVIFGGWGMAPEAITNLLQQPLMIVPTLIFWLVFGPLPEEPGWRGYALDGLQQRNRPWLASLSVGIIWALWHLPLFFIEGTWQAENIGLLTPRFWLFNFSLLFESFIYTWIVNNTRRSILAAILFHFSTNAFGELFELSPKAEAINFLLLVLFVGVILVGWLKSNAPSSLRII